ncbi:NAD(P)-binding protein [Martensiomyces pterosporus]|nr:NAD(P)-binding protein [Martensiomyces pterosporus]
MTKVLVIGANGFIGNAVAQAFSRAGYLVYGLVRSEEKGGGFAADEIIRVVGSTTNPESYADILDKPNGHGSLSEAAPTPDYHTLLHLFFWTYQANTKQTLHSPAMTKVLVIGANGFIGNAVAQAFSRAGYLVYGLVRSEEKGEGFAADEIIRVVGSTTNPESYADILDKVDILVDASAPHGGDPTVYTNTLFQAIKTSAEKRAAGGGVLTFIFTTGVWVHGGTGHEPTSQDAALAPIKGVEWRPATEVNAHKTAPNVRSIVIRPGLVYGKSGSLTGFFFPGVTSGKIRFPGDLKNRVPTIHVDDLADLYVKVADKSPLLSGLNLVAANRSAESIAEIIEAVRGISDKEIEVETYESDHFIDIGLSTNQVFDTRLTRNVTGWEPRKLSLIDGISLYYEAWKAHNAQQSSN